MVFQSMLQYGILLLRLLSSLKFLSLSFMNCFLYLALESRGFLSSSSTSNTTLILLFLNLDFFLANTGVLNLLILSSSVSSSFVLDLKGSNPPDMLYIIPELPKIPKFFGALDFNLVVLLLLLRLASTSCWLWLNLAAFFAAWFLTSSSNYELSRKKSKLL